MSKSVVTAASDATVSVFDLIGDATTSVSKLANVVNHGISMLEASVSEAKYYQEKNHKLEREAYDAVYDDAKKFRVAQAKRDIQIQLQQDPELAKLFAEL